MKCHFKYLVLTVLCLPVNAFGESVGLSHGLSYPEGWQFWSTLSSSHRVDNETLRVILGNDIAIKAARSGEIMSWPNGAILAKVVWKQRNSGTWPSAVVPGEFVHVEFMFKEKTKYARTQGWGWGRWVGQEQKPFNEGAQVCINCHDPVKLKDWVFTEPAQFPTGKK